MKTKRIRRRKQTKRKQRGGVVYVDPSKVDADIFNEIKQMSTVSIISDGMYGIVFRLSRPTESTILYKNGCGLKSIIIKLVGIDSVITFTDGSKLELVTFDLFEKEITYQNDVSYQSLERFGCSITPSIIYASIFTGDELAKEFPQIRQMMNHVDKVGIIFMEDVEEDAPVNTVQHLPPDKQLSMFPLLRRLLIMLADLGYFHNDFHLNNFLCVGDKVFIIDFGRATKITETTLKVERLPNEENIIEFIHGLKHHHIVNDYDRPEVYQWLRQNDRSKFISGIDKHIDIASVESVIEPLRLKDEVLKTCIEQKTRLKTNEKYETESLRMEKKRAEKEAYKIAEIKRAEKRRAEERKKLDLEKESSTPKSIFQKMIDEYKRSNEIFQYVNPVYINKDEIDVEFKKYIEKWYNNKKLTIPSDDYILNFTYETIL